MNVANMRELVHQERQLLALTLQSGSLKEKRGKEADAVKRAAVKSQTETQCRKHNGKYIFYVCLVY